MSESSSARDRGPVTAKGRVVRRKPLLCVTVSVVGADGTWEPQACRGSLQRHAVQVITALRRGRDLGDVARVTRRHMVPGCSPVSGSCGGGQGCHATDAQSATSHSRPDGTKVTWQLQCVLSALSRDLSTPVGRDCASGA